MGDEGDAQVEPAVNDGVDEPAQEPAQPELTAEELENFTMKKRLNDEQYYARVRKVGWCFPMHALLGCRHALWTLGSACMVGCGCAHSCVHVQCWSCCGCLLQWGAFAFHAMFWPGMMSLLTIVVGKW